MIRLFTLGLLFSVCFCSTSSGQHADIEMGYDDASAPTALLIADGEFTCEDIRLYESDFVALDPFNQSDLGADDPGFATNFAEGLTLNAGDQLWIKALDASEHSQFGHGYVTFFDPASETLEAFGQLSIIDNSSATTDLDLDGTSASGAELQFIDFGSSSGGIHDHVEFDLLNEGTTPVGAMGIMFELHVDVAPADGEPDFVSEPFWIIFNHEMSSADFENDALAAFGLIPNATITEVVGDSVNVARGQFVSGTPSELGSSDNADFVARRSNSDISSRVFLEVTATSPTTSPALMDLTFEAAIFARSTVVQSIDLFNYDTNDWEEVDSRNAARFTDSVVSLELGSNGSRFIDATSSEMVARIRFQSANPRQKFTVNADHVMWTIKD